MDGWMNVSPRLQATQATQATQGCRYTGLQAYLFLRPCGLASMEQARHDRTCHETTAHDTIAQYTTCRIGHDRTREYRNANSSQGMPSIDDGVILSFHCRRAVDGVRNALPNQHAGGTRDSPLFTTTSSRPSPRRCAAHTFLLLAL